METTVTIVGAGLAGSEAAWQLARRGVPVRLYEMRPKKSSPVHTTDLFAELVCSNSLRSDRIENAVGLLKEEMRRLDSIVMRAADATCVPAGGALAVDRTLFSQYITNALQDDPLVEIVREEVTQIPDGFTIIASGPLTSDALAETILMRCGSKRLSFYDAVAPIVSADSLDMDKIFAASRYDKGDDDYLNCPMDQAQYDAFVEALVTAERAPMHEFESVNVFEGCMPVESMADRGHLTLAHGPLKPMGLTDPRTGKRPYAVVQLRMETRQATCYNLVGFQTRLKFGEQKRVFSMIPGLENAQFLRYGVMHRNTFLDSPGILGADYRLLDEPRIAVAGQLCGVEGYVESAASGLYAAVSMANRIAGKDPVIFPCETAIGAMGDYVSRGNGGAFQPMNVNFGIMPPLDKRVRNKIERGEKIAARALEALANAKQNI